jgi:hypothetical protein
MELGVQSDNIPSKNVAVINIDKKEKVQRRKRKTISPIANAVPDIQQRWRIWEAIDKPNMTRNVEVQEDMLGKLNELFGNKLTGREEALKSFKSNVVEGYIGGEPASQKADEWSRLGSLFGNLFSSSSSSSSSFMSARVPSSSASSFASPAMIPVVPPSSYMPSVPLAGTTSGLSSAPRGGAGSRGGVGSRVAFGMNPASIQPTTLRPTPQRVQRENLNTFVASSRSGATGIPTVGTSTMTGHTVNTGRTGASQATTVQAVGTDDDNLSAMMTASLLEAEGRRKAEMALKRFGKSLGQRQIAKNIIDIEKQFKKQDVKNIIAGAKRRERGQGASPLLG